MSLWQTPAIVVALLTWLLLPPSNLADASRREALRRQLLPKAARSLTNQDVAAMPKRPLPAPSVSGEDALTAVATPAAPDSTKKELESGKKALETHDEPWWHARMATARETLDRDQILAESLQGRVNSLTNEASARDDPAQRDQLYAERVRVLAELEKMKDQLVADQKAIDAIEEEARTLNIPAGWIR